MKFTLFLLFVNAFTYSFSQSDKDVVSLLAFWNKGDTIDYRVTKIKTTHTNGFLVKNDSTVFDAKFIVLDTTETGYRIKWQYKVDFSQMNISEKLEIELADFALTEAIYTTDNHGSFIAMENWEEIAEKADKMYTIIMNSSSNNTSKSKEDFYKLISPLQTQLGIEQIVFKELQYLHFGYGIEYDPLETYTFQEEIPNLLGEQPIRSQVKLYVDSIDNSNSFFVLKHETELNDSDMKNLVLSVLEKTDFNKRKIKKELKTALFSITDSDTFAYFYYPGIPYNIKTKRKTRIYMDGNNTEVTEIYRIKLIE